MSRLPRSSRAYRALRRARNAVSNARNRTPAVDRTTYVHPSAQVSRDLRAEEYAFVGPGAAVAPGVSIGRYAMLAAGVAVVGADHEWRVPGVPIQFAGRPAPLPTRIGRDAWLGHGATVMVGVQIGEGAVVAARAVVTKDVPPYEVWAGVPARRIATRFEGQDRERHSAAINGPLIEPAFAGPRAGVDTPTVSPAPDRVRHLCILTTAHPLDDVRVHTKIATSYLNAGWRVTWVGPDYSFFAGEGFRAPGIDYVLTPPPAGRRDRLASAGRVARAARAVQDVDWWYSPDPDAAAVAVRTARRQGGKVVFDIHEEFHGSMLDRWTFGRPVRAIREAVRRRVAQTCAACDLVVGVNDAVLTPFVPPGAPHFTVRNCAPRWFAQRLGGAGD
ncbi:MAG: DapH/DapD/GlmU-related protein, partial [Micrococcales bacterium]|nr:DapH/DapD/GlmU-related protein [Micrococcales bacterium]